MELVDETGAESMTVSTQIVADDAVWRTGLDWMAEGQS